MTLKTRNFIFKMLAVITSLFFLLYTMMSVFHLMMGIPTFPDNASRLFEGFKGNFFMDASPLASITSIMAIALYVPVVYLILFLGFEKTHSTETIYFSLFLFGLFMQTIRIFIPMVRWLSETSISAIIITRLTITGRFLSIISLLFSALFSGVEHRQNVERNMLIIFLVSIAFGFFFPLNTSSTNTTFTVAWSYESIYLATNIIICISSFVALVANSFSGDQKHLLVAAGGYILIVGGFEVLCNSDSWILLAMGVTMLTSGTFIYFRSIHRIYMFG